MMSNEFQIKQRTECADIESKACAFSGIVGGG